MLDELGLGERFAALPQTRLDELAFSIDADHKIIMADFRRLRAAHPYIAMVPRWDLLDLLARAGAEEPTYTLRMQTEVTELIRESGQVRDVRYRTEEGRTGELRADLTIACDGRWSIAREQADLTPKELPVPLDTWWFQLPHRPGDAAAAPTPVAGDGRFLLIIPARTSSTPSTPCPSACRRCAARRGSSLGDAASPRPARWWRG